MRKGGADDEEKEEEEEEAREGAERLRKDFYNFFSTSFTVQVFMLLSF